MEDGVDPAGWFRWARTMLGGIGRVAGSGGIAGRGSGGHPRWCVRCRGLGGRGIRGPNTPIVGTADCGPAPVRYRPDHNLCTYGLWGPIPSNCRHDKCSRTVPAPVDVPGLPIPFRCQRTIRDEPVSTSHTRTWVDVAPRLTLPCRPPVVGRCSERIPLMVGGSLGVHDPLRGSMDGPSPAGGGVDVAYAVVKNTVVIPYSDRPRTPSYPIPAAE
jgi:hypothetical protein